MVRVVLGVRGFLVELVELVELAEQVVRVALAEQVVLALTAIRQRPKRLYAIAMESQALGMWVASKGFRGRLTSNHANPG